MREQGYNKTNDGNNSMSKTNQSLITAYRNNDDNIVLKYGNFANCDFDNLDIETIVINKDDLIAVSEALAAASFLKDGEEDQ